MSSEYMHIHMHICMYIFVYATYMCIYAFVTFMSVFVDAAHIYCICAYMRLFLHVLLQSVRCVVFKCGTSVTFELAHDASLFDTSIVN